MKWAWRKSLLVFFFLEGGSLSRYNLIIEIVIHSLSCCSLFSFLLFCRFLSLAREKGIYFLIDRKKEGIMSIIYWNGWILWFFFCIISSLRTDLLGGIRLMVKQFVKLSWVKFGSQKFKFHQFRQLKLVQKCATSLKTYKSLPLSPNSSIYLQQQKSIQLSVKSTLLLLYWNCGFVVTSNACESNSKSRMRRNRESYRIHWLIAAYHMMNVNHNNILWIMGNTCCIKKSTGDDS